MKIVEKYRFAILGAIISIAVILRIWQVIYKPPASSDLSTDIAATIIGLFIIPLVYKIAKRGTNTEAALFSAALSAAIPIYSWKIAAQLSHTLALGFFFLTLLLFAHLKEIKDWKKIIFVPLIFAFIHIYSLLLIPVFGLYFIFCKLEDKKLSRNEIIFAGVAALFIFLIFMAFTSSSAMFAIIKQYLEMHYYAIRAENFTLIKILSIAGMLPIYIGFLGAYYGIKMKKKVGLIMLSAISVLAFSMLINAIPLALGLPYFTFSLAIMGSFSYEEFKKRLQISRFKNYEKEICAIIFIIVLILGALHWIINNII